MEATIQQRQQHAQLNQERPNNNPGDDDRDLHKENESSADITALVIFLPLAITADVLGALDLTGFGAILVRFVDIPILGILWLWRILKQGPGKQPYTYQLLLAFLVEISPLGIIPTWTVFVVYVYFKDTKIGKATIGKAEKIKTIKK